MFAFNFNIYSVYRKRLTNEMNAAFNIFLNANLRAFFIANYFSLFSILFFLDLSSTDVKSLCILLVVLSVVLTLNLTYNVNIFRDSFIIRCPSNSNFICLFLPAVARKRTQDKLFQNLLGSRMRRKPLMEH